MLFRLFGPKRKMTSAIARWHSNARPPSDALEQAYADQLEAEMQEMAIQLHKVSIIQIQGWDFWWRLCESFSPIPPV